jgi:hypothetical protein
VHCTPAPMIPLAAIGRLFPRNPDVDVVHTRLVVPASAQEVWRGMLFYEEVPRRPMPLLRAFLPLPIRTRGEKTRVGSIIECTYDGGSLEKCITGVEPERAVRFDVRVQRLGIESCITMTGGSYEIRPVDGGSEVVLATSYRGHLRPRWVWRPFERYLAHRLHHHILDGMAQVLRAARDSGQRRQAPVLAGS